MNDFEFPAREELRPESVIEYGRPLNEWGPLSRTSNWVNFPSGVFSIGCRGKEQKQLQQSAKKKNEKWQNESKIRNKNDQKWDL